MPTSTHASHCHCHGTPAHSKPPLHAPTLTISASARLAQSAERKALNLVVVGSSPTVGVDFARAVSGLVPCMTSETHVAGQAQDKIKCISRESNPGHIDGNDVFCH